MGGFEEEELVFGRSFSQRKNVVFRDGRLGFDCFFSFSFIKYSLTDRSSGGDRLEEIVAG